ncbi:MAG: hypothetical protein ACFNLN_07745, partial [Treponema socranskii subsp. buccale]
LESDCAKFLRNFACHRSERLGGIAAASRSAFFIISYLFSVYTFFMRNPWLQGAFVQGTVEKVTDF